MNEIVSLALRIRDRIREFVDKDATPCGYSTYFNPPVKFQENDWYVNERIVETAFVHKHIDLDGVGRRILDFGCTRSHLALQLASLGYQVSGVDLRDYRFTHPRFTFYRQNLIDFQDGAGFDYIVSVSTLEHVGLGAYGEGANKALLEAIATKLSRLLKPAARLIVTVPFGREYQDEFLRSFTHAQISQLFSAHDLRLLEERYYCRKSVKWWHPCDREAAEQVSNSAADRGATGVNCVGCFVWQRVPGNEGQ